MTHANIVDPTQHDTHRARLAVSGLAGGATLMALNGLKQVIAPAFTDRWADTLTTLGLDPTATSVTGLASLAVFAGTATVYGFSIAGLYGTLSRLATRRLSTAVGAACAIWTLGHLVPMAGYASIGIFPMSLVWLTTGLSLVEFVIAALIVLVIYERGRPSPVA